MAYNFESANNREGYELYVDGKRTYVRQLKDAQLDDLLKVAALQENVVGLPKGRALRNLVEMEKALRADKQRSLMNIFEGIKEMDEGPWKVDPWQWS